MVVTLRELVCRNRGCEFFAGSLIDFIKFHRRRTWEEAAAEIIDSYPGNLDTLGLSREFLEKSAAQDARTKRELFTLVRSGLRMPREELRFQKLRAELESHRVFIRDCPLMLFLGDGETLQNLTGLLEQLSQTKLPVFDYANDPLVFLPYFTDFHSVGVIEIFIPGSGRTLPLVFDRRNTAFFGLLTADPGAGRFFFTERPEEAAALRGRYRTLEPDWSFLSARMPDVSALTRIQCDQGIYLYREREIYDRLLAVKTSSRNLSIMRDPLVSPMGSPVAWDDFVIRELLTLGQVAGKWSSRMRYLLEVLGLSDEGLRRLILELHNRGLSGIADELRDTTKQEFARTIGNITIETAPGGYLGRMRNGPLRELTNYTLHPEHVILFEDSAEIFYSGQVHIRDKSFPFLVADADLNNLTTLNASLVRAQVTAEGFFNNHMPSMLDTSCDRALKVFLRHRFSSLPKRQGLSMLGWNATKTSFSAPGWRTDEAGHVFATTLLPHPARTIFDLFSFDRPFQVENGKPSFDFPPGVEDVITMSMALVCRFYYQAPTYPVGFQATPEAFRVLGGLFRGLGQINTLGLSRNQRAVTSEATLGVEGYPLLASGYTPEQLSKSRLPVLCLTSDGLHLEDPGEEVIQACAFWFDVILRRCVSALTCDRIGQLFHLENTGNALLDLLVEGRRFIRQAAGLPEWGAGRHNNVVVEKFLRPFNETSIGTKIRMRFADQTAVVNIRGTSTTRDELIRALQPLVETIEPLDRSRFKVDLSSMLQILKDFYKVPVTLPGLEDDGPVELPVDQELEGHGSPG